MILAALRDFFSLSWLRVQPETPMNNALLATIEDVPVHWDGSKLSWTTGARIDADGSPRAYGPKNSGLDYTANAGKPGNWYGIATDKKGNPIVQGKADPFPGMYVSTTAYVHEGFGAGNPRRYLDSEKVPYVVIPGKLRKQVPGIVLGCLARVTNTQTGETVEAVVGDVGPSNKIGEVSIALADALGIPSGARNGGISKPVITYEVFPGQVACLNGVTYRLQPA